MRFVTHKWVLGTCILLLVGCVEPAPSTETVEICDSSGCSERSSDSATFDPSQSVPDPDPEGRLPALVAAAEADPRAAFDLGIRYMRRRRHRAEQLASTRVDCAMPASVVICVRRRRWGRLYLTGLEEMGADYNEAQRWLSMAAARGDKEIRQAAEGCRGRTRGRAGIPDSAGTLAATLHPSILVPFGLLRLLGCRIPVLSLLLGGVSAGHSAGPEICF